MTANPIPTALRAAGCTREEVLAAAFDRAPPVREDGGAAYRKHRIATFAKDGSVPLSKLRRDEFVVAPGIIYRKEAARDA